MKRIIWGLATCWVLCAATGCSNKLTVSTAGEAQLLKIEETDGYEQIIITSPKGNVVGKYALTDRNSTNELPVPEDYIRIPVPTEHLVIDSEVYAGALEELGASDRISGLFDAMYVTSPTLKKSIDDKSISDLGVTGTPNTERIITLDPDAIMLSFFEGMNTTGLDQLGFPVVKMYDLQESNPLGRAEWIRLIGRLGGKGEEADSLFEQVKLNYNGLLDKTSGTQKPKVLTEIIYEGAWNTAAANSYHARLIEDAGGAYFAKEENPTGTLNLLPEQVLTEGGDADIWLIRYYGNEDELKNILESDPVYSEIKAYKDGNIYFSDTSSSGLFREFPFHPELLLEDYRKIFSGQTDEGLRYFKRLSK